MKSLVLLNSLEDFPSIEYAANVHGLPQKPINGMFLGIAFLMFVTALSPKIGYDNAAKIAK